MSEVFDISKFNSYRKSNRLEVKRAQSGLPRSLWETYSAFANAYGGEIILGVRENDDKSWETTGLKVGDRDQLLDNFWNVIHNQNKVSECLLVEKDVETYDVNGDLVIAIHVPRAKREQKPVYINNDLFGGTYKRDHTGDYHCTKSQIKAMLRDQADDSADMKVLCDVSLEELNYDSIRAYRNSHRVLRPSHPFERLDDDDYLRSIGAAAISTEDGLLHPTAAGMLMFGDEYNIVRHFPEYFLDYREEMNSGTRWTDRLQSSSGEWSGNIFDFFYIVYNKIIADVKVPFRIMNGERIDTTPVHDALREALVNCLVNADYYGVSGVVIKRDAEKIIFENPGDVRTGITQMRLGGVSDPRNKTLLKMFNLINVGERAGSGVPNIYNVWSDAGWVEPVIEEQFNPDRTTLILEFKDADKTVVDANGKKLTSKTQTQINTVLDYMKTGAWYKAEDCAKILGVKVTRAKDILRMMVAMALLETSKETKGKSYRKL